MVVKFIDLFAGMGGTRIGFELALSKLSLQHQCVFTSEIKPHAITAYKTNFGNEKIYGDITEITPTSIPDFDYLLAGFPCQPFSSAGSRDGLVDDRGGLFFYLLAILKTKRPKGFLLENVDGLLQHDCGKTFQIMQNALYGAGYEIGYSVLDASDFGVPQKRRRLYIIGRQDHKPVFAPYKIYHQTARACIDYTAPVMHSDFTKLLSEKFDRSFLEGKAIKDKRGGKANIHSWDIGLKGAVNNRQSHLLGEILKKRRSKKWAELKGIPWMDGMPLTVAEIQTFITYPQLENDLHYLEKCGYLKLEHPKKIEIKDGKRRRVYKTDAEKGYNIVTGKLSFPLNTILHPDGFAPTFVATEAGKIGIATDQGVRRITVAEGLNFSGFPPEYTLSNLNYMEAFDLIGNTVIPPVIEYVALSLMKEREIAYTDTLSETA